jgi:hypothetical protein
MRFAADSSLLLRLYLRDSSTDSIEHFLKEDAKVVVLSELARVEVLNVLLREQDRASQFLADIQEGHHLRLEPVDWAQAFQQAESLARRFSRTLKPGGHATWFLSLDRNSCQRALAAAAGLRVWPLLDKDEKGLVRHATRAASG